MEFEHKSLLRAEVLLRRICDIYCKAVAYTEKVLYDRFCKLLMAFLKRLLPLAPISSLLLPLLIYFFA